MSRRRLLVIHNLMAGRAWQREKFKAVLNSLSQAGVLVEVAETKRVGHATELAAQAEGFDAVVAAGGDGTMNEVANGVGDLPLGLIPLGTANVLAIELGYPFQPAGIASVLASGPTLKAMPGQIAGRRFVQMASAGFDARVVDNLNAGFKRRFGKAAYVIGGVEDLLSGDRSLVHVVVDGIPYDVTEVIIAKGRHYGGRYVVAPDARLDSSDFQVCLFRDRGALAIAGDVLAAGLGFLHRRKGVHLVSAREISLEAPAGGPVQVDGDTAARLPAMITLDPNPLRLVVPGRA